MTTGGRRIRRVALGRGDLPAGSADTQLSFVQRRGAATEPPRRGTGGATASGGSTPEVRGREPADPSGPDEHQGVLRFPQPVPPPPVEPEPSFSPILPFLGVLLRGRDAPLLAPADQVPPYHPSVGFARDIYVAIAMNGLVDLVGFTFLFQAYLVGRAEGWLSWGAGGALGAVFSLAFGTFAVSLVRKPLRIRRLDLRGACAAVAVAGVGALVAALSAPRAGGVLVALGVGIGSVSALGLRDGSLLFTRALVMLGVGWLVAGPLHEAMFHDEIDRAFRTAGLAAVERRVADQERAVAAIRAERFATCMRAEQQPPDPACGEPRAAAERADLLVQALAFVRGQELTGGGAARNQAFLLERAEASGASAVVALLAAGSTGRAGHGPRYQEAVKLAPSATRDADAARDAAASCLAAAAACESALADDPGVASIDAQIAALRHRAVALRTGEADPGPIDRALALEALIAGPEAHGGGDDEGSSTEVLQEGRAGTIRGKLFAAWFLAMVMPVLVLVMKVSAADRLEPYLKRRWAGR